MVMSVNANVLSLTAQRNMMGTQNSLSTSIERLSTGLRINSAKDDAAGLAIAERFTSSIHGLSVAQRNASDGIRFAQTAEDALDVIGNNLQRMRELAVQSLNDSNTKADREALDQEVQQLVAEVRQVAEDTTFNGRKILDGSLESLNFQIGAGRGQTLGISGVDARASELSGEQLAATGPTQENTEADASGSLGTVDINGGAAVDLSSATNRQDVVDAINNAHRDGTVAFGITTSTTAAALKASINASAGPSDIVALINENGQLVLTGGAGAQINVADSAESLSVGSYLTAAAKTFTGGIEISASVARRFEANNALVALDGATDLVTAMRADLGAEQNRFEDVIEVAGVQSENLSAARSQIPDADFDTETTNLNRSQITPQAGLASLSQADASPQAVPSAFG